MQTLEKRNHAELQWNGDYANEHVSFPATSWGRQKISTSSGGGVMVSSCCSTQLPPKMQLNIIEHFNKDHTPVTVLGSDLAGNIGSSFEHETIGGANMMTDVQKNCSSSRCRTPCNPLTSRPVSGATSCQTPLESQGRWFLAIRGD